MDHYDVVIAGGSIAGLLAAREIAYAKNISVMVLEEDPEIGTPEHCGGLVSMEGIENLGIIPSYDVLDNKIKSAKFFSPSSGFEVKAESQNVIVLNRRAFDKQIAFQAQKTGAEIRVKCSMISISSKDQSNDSNHPSGHIVKTTEGELECDYFIDGRGIASLLKRSREGILQSAQYEVYAPWIDRDTVEVQFDNQKYPGFFAWIIPTSSGKGKVGVAGRSINAAKVLKSYMDNKAGKYTVVRRVYAPIWIMGPIESFLNGPEAIVIGDAAGQTKPTTAGGIYSCGMGGILAGRAVVNAIENNRDALLGEYQKDWSSIFGAEFKKMKIAREILERLDNKALDELFSSISENEISRISAEGNFDIHSTAIYKILGAKHTSKIIKTLLGNEARRLLW
jgi:digeranylgeranylglycerophospholipid reductase